MKLPQLSLRDLFWLVAVVAMGCGSSPVQNTPSPTLHDLQGKWELVSLSGDGESAETEKLRIAGFVLAIDGTRFTIRSATGKLFSAGQIVIHESTTPTQIDFVGETVGEKEGTTKLGIVQITNGRLQWCYAHGEGSRPTEFAAPAAPEGSKATLSEFERIP